jgi:hypothetical protein
MNFKIKILKSVGNPDFGQFAPVSNPLRNIKTKTLSQLKDKVNAYIDKWSLGGGNFIQPSVYHNNKIVGYFSYNGRFWRTKYHTKPKLYL